MEVGSRLRFNASADVNSSIIRFIASPPLAPHALEDLSGAFAAGGRLLATVNDSDVGASALSIEIAHTDVEALLTGLGERYGSNLSAGRAFRLDVMSSEPDKLGDEALRSIAVALHGSFSAPVYVARVSTPAAPWAFLRPMPWGRKGLAVGQAAPTLPFGGSECLGVAIEVGRPTLIVKARMESLPEHGLMRACVAVGGAESGFADVGAYPAVSAADGASVVVLEFGDPLRAPVHRALHVLDIEARRFGGRLGQTAVLSHLPLEALLGVLRAETGLGATTAQVLETHLPPDGAR